MTLHTIQQWTSLIFLLLSCGTALWLGRWPERAAAVAMALAWFASAVVLNKVRLWGVDTTVMLVDVALFATITTIALRSDRWWPMVASAFLGLVVLIHLAVILDPKIWGRSYFVAANIFSYLTMLTLLAGALTRAARGEADRS